MVVIGVAYVSPSISNEMNGRIDDARTAIVDSMPELQDVPREDIHFRIENFGSDYYFVNVNGEDTLIRDEALKMTLDKLNVRSDSQKEVILPVIVVNAILIAVSWVVCYFLTCLDKLFEKHKKRKMKETMVDSDPCGLCLRINSREKRPEKTT